MTTNPEQDLTSLIGALSSLVNNLQLQQQSSSVKELLQTQILTFEQYNESSEDFDSYCQRLQNFLKIKGLDKEDSETEEAKVMVLINCLGSKYYKLLSSLTAPDLPASKKFSELINLLKIQLVPKRNILTEQHKFLSRVQNQGESIATYVAALKELIKTCDIKTECSDPKCIKYTMNLFVRTQFIRGLNDPEIREKLLQQTDITLENILKTAYSIEAAKIQNREHFQCTTSSSSSSIQKIETNFKKRHNRNKSDNIKKHSFNHKDTIDFQKLGLSGKCLHYIFTIFVLCALFAINMIVTSMSVREYIRNTTNYANYFRTIIIQIGKFSICSNKNKLLSKPTYTFASSKIIGYLKKYRRGKYCKIICEPFEQCQSNTDSASFELNAGSWPALLIINSVHYKK